MKIIAYLFGLLAFGLAVLAWVTANPSFSTPPKGEALAVSAEILRAHVDALVGPGPHRTILHPEALNKAADYVKAQWEKMGFAVEEQAYEVGGRKFRNLIISYLAEGVAADAPRLVVGAHYDVCMDLPGADDNASGVAGLLELSRVIAANKPKLKYRLDLVAWTLEEPPSYDTAAMGSFVHAKALSEAGVRVELALSLEMIGYFSDAPASQEFPLGALKLVYPSVGNFIAVVGDYGSWRITRQAKESMQRMSELPVYSINAPRGLKGIDYSDHRSFWHFGYSALMITDTSFYRNKAYHTPQDTADRLDYRRMADVVKGVYGILVFFE